MQGIFILGFTKKNLIKKVVYQLKYFFFKLRLAIAFLQVHSLLVTNLSSKGRAFEPCVCERRTKEIPAALPAPQSIKDYSDKIAQLPHLEQIPAAQLALNGTSSAGKKSPRADNNSESEALRCEKNGCGSYI